MKKFAQHYFVVKMVLLLCHLISLLMLPLFLLLVFLIFLLFHLVMEVYLPNHSAQCLGKNIVETAHPFLIQFHHNVEIIHVERHKCALNYSVYYFLIFLELHLLVFMFIFCFFVIYFLYFYLYVIYIIIILYIY